MKRRLLIALAVVIAIATFALPALVLAEDPPPVTEPAPTPAPATCECPKQGFGYQKPEDSILCRLWADELNLFYWSDMDRKWWQTKETLGTNPRLDDMRRKEYYRRDISACPVELWK